MGERGGEGRRVTHRVTLQHRCSNVDTRGDGMVFLKGKPHETSLRGRLPRPSLTANHNLNNASLTAALSHQHNRPPSRTDNAPLLAAPTEASLGPPWVTQPDGIYAIGVCVCAWVIHNGLRRNNQCLGAIGTQKRAPPQRRVCQWPRSSSARDIACVGVCDKHVCVCMRERE